MHELSVCQGLVKQLKQIAIEHHATNIEKVYLQVGPLAGIEPTLLQSAFSIASTDTLAEQAQMFIKTMPLLVRCKTCKEESEATLNNLSCAACGDWHTELLSGDELLIERVEMQTRQLSS
jgi:hydrogenase nickel incorporation protein HypA/HybF